MQYATERTDSKTTDLFSTPLAIGFRSALNHAQHDAYSSFLILRKQAPVRREH